MADRWRSPGTSSGKGSTPPSTSTIRRIRRRCHLHRALHRWSQAFEYLLAYLGIKQQNGAPNHPQTQGKIERFHQTLKRWLGQQPGARTIDELQAQLDAFRLVYDEERPHRAIGRLAPAEADQVRPKAHPTGRGASGHFRLRHDFVDRGGRITLRRTGRLHHLGIGAAHVRRRVLAIVDEHEVTVVDLETGEVLSSHLIEPDRSYWRNQRRHVSLLDRPNPRASASTSTRARRFSLGPRDERTHAGRTGTALATAGCQRESGHPTPSGRGRAGGHEHSHVHDPTAATPGRA